MLNRGSKHVPGSPAPRSSWSARPSGTPVALLHHVKANRCLHQTVLLLSILTEDVPTVPDDRAPALRDIGGGIWRAVGHYGYMESPDVSALMDQSGPAGLRHAAGGDLLLQPRDDHHRRRPGMWEWEKSLYGFLIRNARPAKDYYQSRPPRSSRSACRFSSDQSQRAEPSYPAASANSVCRMAASRLRSVRSSSTRIPCTGSTEISSTKCGQSWTSTCSTP